MRRILIDECINPRLAIRLQSAVDVSVSTVRDLGWAGKPDHVLIHEIDNHFDVFLTIEKGFEFEHDLQKRSFGIVILTAANNQMASYERILAELIRQIQHVSPGHVVHVFDPKR